MNETLSTTISFMRNVGAEQCRGYTPIYTPVFWQSPQPAATRPTTSAFEAHLASSISPQAARTLALLTPAQPQDTHSFESLITALTLNRAAIVELPETQQPVHQPSRARRRQIAHISFEGRPGKTSAAGPSLA